MKNLKMSSLLTSTTEFQTRIDLCMAASGFRTGKKIGAVSGCRHLCKVIAEDAHVGKRLSISGRCSKLLCTLTGCFEES